MRDSIESVLVDLGIVAFIIGLVVTWQAYAWLGRVSHRAVSVGLLVCP